MRKHAVDVFMSFKQINSYSSYTYISLKKPPRNYTFTNIYITEQEQVWYYFLPNYNSTLIPTRKGMCTSSIYVYQQC